VPFLSLNQQHERTEWNTKLLLHAVAAAAVAPAATTTTTTTTTLCLKKHLTFTTCYIFYIHSSTVTIFGTNVAEKVDN